jgi:hypothetical protein
MTTVLNASSALDEVIPHILAACSQWTADAGCGVVAHGSRVEGFANATSDVDFWIVAPPGAPPPMLPVFEWDGELRLQPESVSASTLISLAERVNAVRPRDAEAVAALASRDLDSYYRFATAVPLANPEFLPPLRRRFDPGHIGAILACRSGTAGATELRRAALFAAAGDELDESMALRRAVEFSVDALLASQGEAYPNRKWRFEKLARRFGRQSPQFQRAWALKTRELGQSIVDYRHEVHAFIDSLGLPYEPRTLRLSRLQQGSAFRLGRSDFLLIPSTAVYQLTTHSVWLWELLDGAPSLDEVIRIVGERAGMSPLCATSFVHRAIGELRAHGLVELSPVAE